MKNGHIIPGLFFLAFLLAAAWFMSSGALKAQAATKTPQLQTALNGRWAAAYEGQFNKQVETYDTSVTLWGILNYVIFKEGREGVLIGDDGWLFTKEEFDYAQDHDAQIEKKISFIAKTQKIFAQKNTRLLVLLVPAKARIYEEHLGRYEYPDYKKSVYAKTLRALGTRSIATADILPAMQRATREQALFLRTDTHWTPTGAQLAAQATAETMRTQWPGLTLAPAQFRNSGKREVCHEGDLLRYIPLGPLAEKIGPPPDMLQVVKTEKISADTPENATSLFGAEDLPVTLVGTSYSANPDWNFAGFLQQSLRTDVLNVAQEGQGPFETMKKYLADGAFRDNPPELVVWEIPERYLSAAYDLEMKEELL